MVIFFVRFILSGFWWFSLMLLNFRIGIGGRVMIGLVGNNILVFGFCISGGIVFVVRNIIDFLDLEFNIFVLFLVNEILEVMLVFVFIVVGFFELLILLKIRLSLWGLERFIVFGVVFCVLLLMYWIKIGFFSSFIKFFGMLLLFGFWERFFEDFIFFKYIIILFWFFLLIIFGGMNNLFLFGFSVFFFFLKYSDNFFDYSIIL